MTNKTDTIRQFSVFHGDKKIVAGDILAVTRALKPIMENHPDTSVLIFEDSTGNQIDLDLRGTLDEALARQADRFRISTGSLSDTNQNQASKNKPGRPKLGVISKEVTLLPRHWEWLKNQPGGASVTLRKLVERAAKGNKDQVRDARNAAYKVMNTLAGNLPSFEEATRSLYRGEVEKFSRLIADWPKDIRTYIESISKPAWESE